MRKVGLVPMALPTSQFSFNTLLKVKKKIEEKSRNGAEERWNCEEDEEKNKKKMSGEV